jgi:hypothetical protein
MGHFTEYAERLRHDPEFAAAVRQQAAQRERERMEQRAQFLSTFVCSDPTGETAPCRRYRDDARRDGTDDPLEIPDPDGRRAACPAAKTVRCEPFVRLEKLAWERQGHVLGIPPRHLDDTFEALQGKAVDAARRYVEEDLVKGRCLVLIGPYGVGKTAAACAALRAVGRGSFVYFPEFCRMALSPDERDRARVLIASRSLLVLDDVGVEYRKGGGGFIDAVADELFWHREAHMLPTIVTSNLGVEALADRLGGRAVDRLRGDWGRAVEITCSSFRKKKREADV